MVKVDVVYQGSLRCRAVHGPSGMSLITDAPTDNMGKGEAFSPTDLVATALGSCILTTMGIVAQREGIALTDAHASVTKEMSASGPRRITRLAVTLTIPTPLPEDHRRRLEAAARSCPVHKSLHPDIDAPVEIVWGGVE